MCASYDRASIFHCLLELVIISLGVPAVLASSIALSYSFFKPSVQHCLGLLDSGLDGPDKSAWIAEFRHERDKICRYIQAVYSLSFDIERGHDARKILKALAVPEMPRFIYLIVDVRSRFGLGFEVS
jgi:hypothetical protein